MLNDPEIVGFKAIVNTAPQNVLIHHHFTPLNGTVKKKSKKDKSSNLILILIILQ